MSKGKKYLMVVLVILVVGLGGYLVYKEFIEKPPVLDNQEQPGENNDNQSAINLDTSGASAPNLHSNMIPIRWNGDYWVKADKDNLIEEHKWYDYNEQMWANAVTVTNETREEYINAELGTVIKMDDILTMMVWIPRYRYELWNANNGSSNPQEINIIFESKNITPSCGTTTCTEERRFETLPNSTEETPSWLTHPAFRSGTDELDGFWIGKFTTGYRNVTTPALAEVRTPDVNRLVIKPNTIMWRNISNANMFRVSQDLCLDNNMHGYHTVDNCENNVAPQMLTNMQWGAVAYLSHSKFGINGEVWKNPSNSFVTGRSGSGPSIASQTDTAGGTSSTLWGYDGRVCTTMRGWECTGERHATNGMTASTTGNIYGVFDMSGGAWERTMGNMVASGITPPGAINVALSGFTGPFPESRWFDSYRHESSTACTNASPNIGCLNHGRGLLGDATKETLVHFGTNTRGGWYDNLSYFQFGPRPWFSRGGEHAHTTASGVFAFSRTYGSAHNFNSWRIAHR